MYAPSNPNNSHISKLLEYFGNLQAAPVRLADGVKFVFLCYTNRCGSNYVAELLASSGNYNLAGEDLNFDTVIKHSQKHGFKSLQEYLSFLVERYSKSGVFLIKVAPQHIELLAMAGILDQIINSSKFLLIERADKLSQAISFAIAFATGKFTSNIKGHKEVSEVEFSAGQIDDIITGLTESYKKFDLFFAKNGIVPVNISYEQLAARPIAYLSIANEHLGLADFSVFPGRVRIERQRGQVNEEWRQLYLQQSSTQH